MATAPDLGGLAARHGRLPADVLVHDPAGVSRYASPAAVELLGLAGETLGALCRAFESARHGGCRVLAGRQTPLGAQPRLQLRQLALQGIVGRRGAGLAPRGRDQHARWLAGIRGRRREWWLRPQEAQ